MRVLSFIIGKFFNRIGRFFVHWYGRSWFVIGGAALGVVEKLDSFFAVRVNARYFLVPLYKDYTFLGRILGFIFRSLRIIAAAPIV